MEMMSLLIQTQIHLRLMKAKILTKTETLIFRMKHKVMMSLLMMTQ